MSTTIGRGNPTSLGELLEHANNTLSFDRLRSRRSQQVDFADFKLPWGKRYVLLVVLGFSRFMWMRYFRRKDMRALLEGLEAAFNFFGSVPRELLFDQMKSVT